MKRIFSFIFSATMVLSSLSLINPDNVQGSQGTVMTARITNPNPLKGIKKLQQESISAVILGDSIAVSQGASDPFIKGWDVNLKEALFKKYSNDILWDNKASSGTLVDYCLTRAPEIEDTTDLVLICVGRNDRNYYTPSEFSRKYAKLIRLIKRKAPKADIYCIVEPPMVSSDESKFYGIRKSIRNVSSDADVNYLNVWSVFPRDQDELDSLLMDGLHPNDEGYKLMSNYIYKHLVWDINSNN
nr:SGNH/GDSL hydrolase family protein [Desulfosporosinus orientis]